MGALFVSPLSFSVVSANQNTLAPASQANIDEPALTWRSNNLTSITVILDLGTTASYDTVALMGNNLAATDTVRIQTGTTNTGTGSYDSTALAAYSGSAISGMTAKTVMKLGSTRTERYMLITISSASNPSGYAEVQRIVVGKALSLTNGGGVDLGAEFSIVDQSVAYTGNGWRNWDRYARLPQIKISVSMIGNTDFNTSWFGFLNDVGTSKGFLMVPDDTQPANWQVEAFFGTITQTATATITGFNMRRADLTILALAP